MSSSMRWFGFLRRLFSRHNPSSGMALPREESTSGSKPPQPDYQHPADVFLANNSMGRKELKDEVVEKISDVHIKQHFSLTPTSEIKELENERDGEPAYTPIRLSTLYRDPLVIDFGELTTLSSPSCTINIYVHQRAQVEELTDLISVWPKSIDTTGIHKLTITLNLDKIESNSLIETGIHVYQTGEKEFIRVTARTSEIFNETPKSSLVIGTPWRKAAQLYGHRDRATGVAFLRNASTFLSTDQAGNLCWWDLSGAGGELIAVESMKMHIWSLATTRHGDWVAVGFQDGSVVLLSGKDRSEQWRKKYHRGPICSVAFSPDGEYLYAGSFDKTYSKMLVVNGRLCYRTPPQRTVLRSLALSGNGHIVATTNQGRGDISLFESRTGVLIAQLKGHTSDITCVNFSLDDYLLVTGSNDNTVRLWDADQKRETGILNGFSRGVLGVAVSPDGQLLATTSGEPKVRIWNLQSRTRYVDVESGRDHIQSICFSPDQQLLAGASQDGSIYIWQVGASHHL